MHNLSHILWSKLISQNTNSRIVVIIAVATVVAAVAATVVATNVVVV